MAITTGSHPKALWPGVKAWWGRQYDEHPEECVDLFDIEGSTQAYEEDVEVTGFGLAPVKSEGGSITFDEELQGVVNRAVNVAYALGFNVTHEEIQDNLYEIVGKRRAQANAFSMRQTKENVAANVYNNAFTGGPTFGDGVSILNSAHPTRTGNQSNILSTAADLSEAAVEDLVIQIMNAKNSRGLRISLMPESIHVPTASWYEVNRILGSVLQNDTANNAVNVLKAVGQFPKGIKLNHYFTDTDAWFIRTNAPRGMLGYTREAISFDQDNDFATKNAQAAAYERYSFSIGDWRGLFGTPGS